MKYISLLAFPLVLVFVGARGQDNFTALVNSLSQRAAVIKEQLYAHTDKNFYITGELLWFKIYAVDAIFHKPIDLSKVAYVELLDTANKPVVQAKVALKNGDGNGSLYLPVSIASGSYKLRAYTNWMKNFDAAAFFEKNITVVNVQKLTVANRKAAAYKYEVQFFPEGGNLVNGLQSKVAFKVSNQRGKGIAFGGALIDNGDTLLSFKPEQTGIGSFNFMPVQGHTYKAWIQPEEGNKMLIDLPSAVEDGYVMHVKEDVDSNVSISIQSNIGSAGEVYVVVQAGEKVSAAKKAALQKGKAAVVIPLSALPDGISAITVFDERAYPVCERLYFKQPQQKLQLSLNSDQPVYGVRKKVTVTIHTNDDKSSNDSTNMSMAVYRVDSLQSLDNTTIDAYLLLTSGLHGTVEDPAYYLKGDKNAKAAVDNLLLVNGWRKFRSQPSLPDAAPLLRFAPEYNGHIITGKVVNLRTGQPQPNIPAYLSVPGTRTQFYPSASDSSGLVKFETNNFFGSSRIVVQTNEQLDSGYSINIDDPFSHAFSATALPAFTLPESAPNTLLEHSISMQVERIYTGDKINRFNALPADTAAFYLHADKKYKLDDFTRFTTLEEVLREYVELVNVTKREGRYHFPVYDFAGKKMFDSDPLVLIDGVPVFNLNRFITYDPLKINRLEVVNKRYFLGSAVFDGILNWQTYNGDLADFDLDPRAVILDYEGLQLQREFYSPRYETEAAAEGHLPDFRNVLYWSPAIRTAGGKEEQYSFYTSDLPGRYVAVLQGITLSGLCGSAMLTFEVKK